MKGSALSHLVEAATALSELVDASNQSPSSSARQGGVVTSNTNEGAKNRPPSNKKSVKRDIFPKQLMDILSDSSLSDVISWLPHGRSFVIIRPDIFTSTVLPKFLPPVDSRTSTKYPSFTRKLNRWGFRQATKGPDTGAFHHSFFRRDEPELCLNMVCQKSKDRQARQRRSLPPKKRAISEAGSNDEEVGKPSGGRMPASSCLQSSSPANVSSDERSQASLSHSPATTQHSESIAAAPSTVVVPRKDASGVIPYISNDPAFVRRTLNHRDRVEVFRAAKAMLYDSYMKALVSKGR